MALYRITPCTPNDAKILLFGKFSVILTKFYGFACMGDVPWVVRPRFLSLRIFEITHVWRKVSQSGRIEAPLYVMESKKWMKKRLQKWKQIFEYDSRNVCSWKLVPLEWHYFLHLCKRHVTLITFMLIIVSFTPLKNR